MGKSKNYRPSAVLLFKIFLIMKSGIIGDCEPELVNDALRNEQGNHAPARAAGADAREPVAELPSKCRRMRRSSMKHRAVMVAITLPKQTTTMLRLLSIGLTSSSAN